MKVDQNKTYQGDLVVEGNLVCNSIAVAGDLIVSGDVRAHHSLHVTGQVRVGGSLDAGLALRAGGDVTVRGLLQGYLIAAGGTLAAGAIRTQGSIFAGGSIVSAGSVEAANTIIAGAAIRVRDFVFTPTFQIYCQELQAKLMPLGREYWASFPGFANWREQILDPNLCWRDWQALPSAAEIDQLAGAHFGHWSLEGQLRMFLGKEVVVTPPPEAQVKPGSMVVRVAAPPTSVPMASDSSPNLLQQIVDEPAVPFPDYSNNPSYKIILQAVRDGGVFFPGPTQTLRAAYTDASIHMWQLHDVVKDVVVPDPAVKTQILNEINAAANLRLQKQNMDAFLTKTFLGKDITAQYVGGLINLTDGDNTSVDTGGIVADILGGLGAIPEFGAVFVVFQAVVAIATSFDGGFDTVSEKYNELVEALATEFNKGLNANAKIAEALLTDWGKMQKANALIINGTLAWPVDDSTAYNTALNLYEIGLFKALFPIHWWPTFECAGIVYESDTRSGACLQTVWMQAGGWAVPYFTNYVITNQYWQKTHKPQPYNFIPYWLERHGSTDRDCSKALTELARIGVSIKDLTMGTGLWGPKPFAYSMANPVASMSYAPNCVKRPGGK